MQELITFRPLIAQSVMGYKDCITTIQTAAGCKCYGFGQNEYGILGVGVNGRQDTPVPVRLPPDVTVLATVVGDHSLFLVQADNVLQLYTSGHVGRNPFMEITTLTLVDLPWSGVILNIGIIGSFTYVIVQCDTGIELYGHYIKSLFSDSQIPVPALMTGLRHIPIPGACPITHMTSNQSGLLVWTTSTLWNISRYWLADCEVVALGGAELIQPDRIQLSGVVTDIPAFVTDTRGIVHVCPDQYGGTVITRRRADHIVVTVYTVGAVVYGTRYTVAL